MRGHRAVLPAVVLFFAAAPAWAGEPSPPKGYEFTFFVYGDTRTNPDKHARVESTMKADYWLVPSVVYEVLGAEITLSPVHSAGFGKIRGGSGLAVRFPRLKQVRTDKKPEDATTVQELIEMYERQLKKVEL